ncbi:MAG TPA: hypothetical protein VIF83_09385 [Gemmatimonadaceae bacterium]
MTEDDRFDEFLARAAQDYNSPPANVPRDEMWAAIETRRQAPQLTVVRGGARRSVSIPRYVVWSAAAAAVVLVALGVGIGRMTAVTGYGVRGTGNVATTASPERGSAAPSSATATPDVATSNPNAVTRNPNPVSRTPLRVASDTVRPPTRPGGIERKPSKNRSTTPGGSVDQFGPNAYQVATIQHLADAEALLTSFRIESRSRKMDASLSTWARDLLTSTRLLLDSPAADDPRRVRLLQDLELVLAQIVQLSPTAEARERELIEGTIRDGHVMTRLRTAIPAGPTRGL